MITPAHTSGKPPSRWVFLSPHLDDIAMSCGGLVWELTQAGAQVEVWTVCAGDPPAEPLSHFAAGLHRRWGTSPQAAQERRQEDLVSCRIMGAEAFHYPLPDCIYRRSPANHKHLYASEAALWRPVHPHETDLLAALSHKLASRLAPEDRLAVPLGLGRHVDHRLARAAAERLGRPLWYYADYPYVLNCQDELARLSEAGWQAERFEVSAEGLAAWQEAVAAHASQISTFWGGMEEMREAIRQYVFENDGVRVWRPKA